MEGVVAVQVTDLIQTCIAVHMGTKTTPITTVPPAETRRRDIRARPPVRTLWEVAFGMQDLEMPPMEHDKANQQRIFVVQTLT